MATLNASQIAALVRKHWPITDDAVLTRAVAIALGESGGRTDAINSANRNGSRDWGLFQINDVNWTSKDTQTRRLDPDVNTAKAYEVYKRQGLSAWVVYKTGAYEQHMSAAQGAMKSSSGGSVSKGGASNSGDVRDVDSVEGVKMPVATNPLDALTNGLADFQGTLMKLLNSTLLWLIAALFLILGVVIVMRKQIGAAAGLAGGPVVKAATTAAKVAKG